MLSCDSVESTECIFIERKLQYGGNEVSQIPSNIRKGLVEQSTYREGLLFFVSE